jgi:nitroreductase
VDAVKAAQPASRDPSAAPAHGESAAPGPAIGDGFVDLMLRRRSVIANNIGEPGPDDAQLRRILAAALRVPDHGKLTPWRIQVLRKPGQARLGRVLVELFKAEHPGASPKQIEFEEHRPQRAPILLVVSSKPVDLPKIPLMEQLLSAGAVCTTILHACNAMGFAAQWITEWPAYHDKVPEALGHEPGQRIVGFIYIGTAKETPTERPRPGFDDIVSEWR